MRKVVVGQNFAEGVEFTHPATDELGGLRPEVKNDDFLLHREERTKLEKMKEGDAKSRFVFASPEGVGRDQPCFLSKSRISASSSSCVGAAGAAGASGSASFFLSD